MSINSHGAKHYQDVTIQGYNTYMKNTTGEAHDGSAIMIKSDITHKIKDDYMTDILAL